MNDPSTRHFEQRIRRRRRLVGCSLVVLLCLLGVAVAIKFALLKWVEFTDQSMYPNIPQDSTVLSLTIGRPEVGDLVLFQWDDLHVMRRVLAGPGSTVQQTESGIWVDGQLLPRRMMESHTYQQVHSDQRGSALTSTCHVAMETLGGREISICIDEGSERPVEMVRLSQHEIYVRCDNRTFCARRERSEGPVALASVEAVGRWLMSTRDDSDQPFYKRWFGRFERLR